MKIGLILSNAPRASLADIARRADDAGFDSLWVGEHIVLPIEESEDHPYGRPGVVQPRNEWRSPFVELAYFAGLTNRIRLATGVILPPIRNLFVTAREISTLDVHSGGRLDVGLGVGWHMGEFALMGADFASRGAHTDEFMDALTCLFTKDSPSFQGRHIAFEAVGFEPKPVQSPRPPLLVGGDTGPAMRRAAKRGDGWYGHASSPEQARERIEAMKRLVSENGRDVAGFEYVLQVWDPPSADDLKAYAAAGADRVVTAPFKPDDTDPVGAMMDYARLVGVGAGAA